MHTSILMSIVMCTLHAEYTPAASGLVSYSPCNACIILMRPTLLCSLRRVACSGCSGNNIPIDASIATGSAFGCHCVYFEVLYTQALLPMRIDPQTRSLTGLGRLNYWMELASS